MSPLELTKRLLASRGRIDARKLSTGKLADNEWRKLNNAVGRLAELKFFIDEQPALHSKERERREK